MHSPTRWSVVLKSLVTFLLMLSAPPLAAQQPKPVELKFLIPEKIERATRTDEQGLLQWAPFEAQQCATCNGTKESGCKHCERLDEAPNCPECKGTRKAPCRPCGAVGTFPDPLEHAHCPGCQGAALFPCVVCGGRGWQKVTGSGDKQFDCVACRGKGAYECEVCDGKRLVESGPAKPGLAEADKKDLEKVLKPVEAMLEGLEKFEPTGANARKEQKELIAILQKGAKVLPPIKQSPKALDDVMKKVAAGSVFQGHEERAAAALKTWAEQTKYYLKLQKRILELCLQRAEANEKTLAEQKGKKGE